MTMLKYTSKVNYANLQKNSLRCGIPKEVVEFLDITAGESVKWIVDVKPDGTTITVEKLKL